MTSFVKFEKLSEDVASGVHNFDAAGDTLKAYLSNATPNVVTHSIKSNLAEIAMTNEANHGAGGGDVQNSISRSGEVTSVVGSDLLFLASGGTVGPFRYVILYNDTPTIPADPLIGYWDYGSEITLSDGQTFLTDFGTSLFTVT